MHDRLTGDGCDTPWYAKVVRHVGIVGAGLAGLVVAFRRGAAGDRVTVFEASDRTGGQLWTERRDGFVVEHGAEGFVATSRCVPALAERLGTLDSIVEQETFRTYGFDGSTLEELARGQAAAVLGFQVPKGELGRGIRTFRAGMADVADALVHAMAPQTEIRLRTAVARATRVRANAKWNLILEGGTEEPVDEVVVAVPCSAAARILGDTFGSTAEAVRSAPTSSSVTVSLAFDRSAVDHPLDGTGFVMAGATTGLRACTFATSKFARRAPEGTALVRLFFRPLPDEIARDDRWWSDEAERSLARILKLRGSATRTWVSRWADALPIFDAEHSANVRALEARIEGSGVFLVGSAFHGPGIDAAVASADATAQRIEEHRATP